MNSEPCVFIVDDDYAVRDGLALVIETAGIAYQSFESAEQFLQDYCPHQRGCLLLDINMQGLTGLDLQNELLRRNLQLPIIFLTGYGDIPTSVRAIKAGAVDFLTKPVASKLLVERIQTVLQMEAEKYAQAMDKRDLCNRINSLTSRELDLVPLLVSGLANKEIARHLNISYRTVEIHRARILKKTGATNLLELARICQACGIKSSQSS
jgi:FixJ family two-component response regulator